MGFISRKVLPACGNMCVCCPALRPSSRRPVKRYKKLLADIFPKSPDAPPNERKIVKLCEYAARNPFRIPKIVKFLEQRSIKELRSEHIFSIRIIMEAYSKLLCICKGQMVYFAVSLLNVILELFESKQQDTTRILGCQTLTRFIYSQSDNTYAHNIESLVRKVCILTCEQQGENKHLLRAASLQCLSAMVWYMAEYSYVFTDVDEIVRATLENYETDERTITVDESHEMRHNWVDEVVRSETRVGATIATNVGLRDVTIRSRPVTRDSSALTREELESPQVWSHICIQKLAELAKESSTMRRVLDPMFVYFDSGRHWSPGNGLALHVLSDMCYLVKSSGNKQLILSAIIRHLEHKNVAQDPQTKSDIVQVTTVLVHQLRSVAVVAEIGVASDLCRHLRKSLQATVQYVGVQESNWNVSLQNSIQDCLLEIAKGIGDARQLLDMMAIIMENLPAVKVVARATMETLLILARIISLTSVHSRSQLVFPEGLLVQLTKIMVHPDVETRIIAHQIFSVILVRTPSYSNYESDYLYEPRKWQAKTNSPFVSATALLEKLRREKECLNGDKIGNDHRDDISLKEVNEEELKHDRARKGSPYFYKLNSIIDRSAITSYDQTEVDIIILNEDQIAHLLSAFWVQANQPDNLPSTFQAIAHSFSLTLLSSRIKNSNHSNTVRFFQLPLSLLKASMHRDDILHPSCQRSLFTMAVAMLTFAGKLYHIYELTGILKLLISYDVDPYLKIGDDLQLCIKPQADLEEYGSDADYQAATSTVLYLRNTVDELHQQILDIIIQSLSNLTSFEDDLAKQLSETFTPEDGPLFGPKSSLNIESLALSEESLSFDEEQSRSSSIAGDAVCESPATDLPSSISKMPTRPSLPHIVSIGQLLESALHVAGQVAGSSVSTSPLPYGAMASQCEALGMGMRKKLSTWLVTGQESTSDGSASAPKVDAYGLRRDRSLGSAPTRALRLPPASPFDNFMKAAGC